MRSELYLRVALRGGRHGFRFDAAVAMTRRTAAVLLVRTAPHGAREAAVPRPILVCPALTAVKLRFTATCQQNKTPSY